MHKKLQETKSLYSFIPEKAITLLQPLLQNQPVHFKISRGRTTKFGDFTASTELGNKPTISINANLNPYSFLITLIHEFAHFLVWQEGHYYTQPHGRSWKNHFKKLMNFFIAEDVFPENLRHHLVKHLVNPKATSCSDAVLFKELSKFDPDKPGIYIDDLPDNVFFETSKGDVFRKLKKIRSRSLCKQIKSGKKYLFSPVYRVYPVKDRQYIMVFPLFFIFLPKINKLH